jgi:hypothetical protein
MPILTDIIQPSNLSARGLLLSSRTKAIVEKLNIIDHQFYPATIVAKGVIYEYYWLHLVKPTLQGIDFPASQFYLASITHSKLKNLDQIPSEQEYFNVLQKTEFQHILAEKIELTDEVNSLNRVSRVLSNYNVKTSNDS